MSKNMCDDLVDCPVIFLEETRGTSLEYRYDQARFSHIKRAQWKTGHGGDAEQSRKGIFYQIKEAEPPD
ncbi:hypothetical protein NQ317_010963 [Molorchus minor]|uniref:Uncharacterized protein n=1 Tax=Molorchus minor TaxID=1323400 RepID=A0ABQ9JUT9_9CUCU|nr:hypothetical protein NQ317_010963 [Molorchus minor]